MKKNIVKFGGILSEMSGENKFEVNVPIAQGVNLAELTKGDDSPMFVVIEALNETVSKNGRRYTPKVLHEIAKQINENRPDGYEGHLSKEEIGHKRPEPKTIWVGAVVKEIEGTSRLFAKGYVLPYATDLKTYLSAAKATVKKVAVSIYGMAEQVWNSALNAYDIAQVELQSIDWVRPGSEGVPTAGYLAITAEMEQGNTLTREEIVGSLTVSEIQSQNATVLQEMKEVVKTEVIAEVKKEETGQLRAIREMMSVDSQANVVTCIAEMSNELAELRKFKANSLIADTLRDNVPASKARQVVQRLVLSEMKAETPVEAERALNEVLRSEETQAIIKEMSELHDVLPTVTERNTEPGRKFTKVENNK